MKVFTYIFSFYMILLSLAPCGDGGNGIIEIVHNILNIEYEHISDHEEHSNSCGDDSCTPFCICSCCSTPVYTIDHFEEPTISIFSQPDTKPSFIPNLVSSSINLSIWQPPKFS